MENVSCYNTCIVVCVFVTVDTCLPNYSLATGVFGSVIPGFRRHVAIVSVAKNTKVERGCHWIVWQWQVSPAYWQNLWDYKILTGIPVISKVSDSSKTVTSKIIFLYIVFSALMPTDEKLRAEGQLAYREFNLLLIS